MNQKGSSLSWTSVIEIVLAVLIILSSAYFLSGLLGWLGTPQEGQITKNNFDGLVNVINEAVNQNQEQVLDSVPFYIEQGYAIVGFHKNINSVKLKNSDVILKPSSLCGDSACLCLYTEKQFYDKNLMPKECSVLPNVDSIFSWYFEKDKIESWSVLELKGTKLNAMNAFRGAQISNVIFKPNIISYFNSLDVFPSDLIIYESTNEELTSVINLEITTNTVDGKTGVLIDPYDFLNIKPSN